MSNLEEMLGWKFNKCGYWYFIVLWKGVTPLLLLVSADNSLLSAHHVLTEQACIISSLCITGYCDI